MSYRQPLLDAAGNLSGDHWQLVSDSQRAKLCQWSIVHNRSVMAILTDSRFMVEDEGQGATVKLEGTLPGCNLYGVMLSDGSTHT